jgi:lanosterol synthase
MVRSTKDEKKAAGVEGDYKAKLVDKQTDKKRWRLLDERGRQTWHYLHTEAEVKQWPQSTADKWFLGLPTVPNPCKICLEALG